MATTRVMSEAEVHRIEAMTDAGQLMADAEESQADREWGRKVLRGEVSAEQAIAARIAEIRREHGISD